MNDQRDENQLDELIKLSINTAKPEFNVEQWKTRYPEEYRILLKQKTVPRRIRAMRVGLSAAAMIAVIVGLFLITHDRDQQKEPPRNPAAAQSPAEMLTAISLKMAYRRGGIEAVDKQCETAVKMLGPRSSSLSVKELLIDFNGS
jgi:hypothetical protein